MVMPLILPHVVISGLGPQELVQIGLLVSPFSPSLCDVTASFGIMNAHTAFLTAIAFETKRLLEILI